MSGKGIVVKSLQSQVRRVIFAKFLEDEDILEATASAAKMNAVDSGFFFLIGTLKKAVLGYYKKGIYIPIKKAGSLEIASCLGNVSVKEDGELVVHAHIVVSDSKAITFAGHVLAGCLVDATAELVLVAVEDGKLRRTHDPQRNLNLWSFNQ